MTQTRMLEGTAEEITQKLQQSYAGQKLRVYVEPEEAENEEDLATGIPDPPDTIRDKAHLMELLHEGMQGQPQVVTDQEWADIRQQVRERLARKQQ